MDSSRRLEKSYRSRAQVDTSTNEQSGIFSKTSIMIGSETRVGEDTDERKRNGTKATPMPILKLTSKYGELSENKNTTTTTTTKNTRINENENSVSSPSRRKKQEQQSPSFRKMALKVL